MRCLTAFFLALGCLSTPQGFSQTSVDWDHAFLDASGSRPLHFTARYSDSRGPHHLEVWRAGQLHLRRRTDDRIDLHADAQNRQGDYLWQIIDLQHHIDNRISSHAMLQAGLLYNFYSMAHVLTRPPGRFRLETLAIPAAGPTPCTWYELTPDAQPPTRICWSGALAIPVVIQAKTSAGTWDDTFTLLTHDRNLIPAAIFAVNPTGLTIRDHDQMAADD